MGRRGPSRSLFAALPPDLRSTIRTNGRVAAENGPDIDAFGLRVKQELVGQAEGSRPMLLRTQPPSASPERDAAETDGGVPHRAESPSWAPASPPWPSTEVAEPEAGPSYTAPRPTAATAKTARAVKRRREEGVWVISSGPSAAVPPQKRRKGKELAVYNAYAGHPWDCTGLVMRYNNWDLVPEDIKKYYSQRHSMFEEYDELPLLLDHTGWFSVTPQAIARHIAERCRCDVIVDAFCGIGGNAIEFAKTCERAIDNDLTRLKLARHNALQYGVADRIEFVHASYTDWARAHAQRADKETIDVVFLSPPWGGVHYLTVSADPLPFPPTPFRSDPTGPRPITHKFPLSAILPIPGDELFHITSAITPNIAYYLPRNVDHVEVAQLARSLEPPEVVETGLKRDREWVEMEQEIIGDRTKAVTVYYGSLIGDGGDTGLD